MLFWNCLSGIDIKLHFLLEEISSMFLIYTRISPEIRIYDIYYSSSTYGICYFICRRKAAEFDTSCLWQICYLLLICLLSSSYLKIIILYVYFPPQGVEFKQSGLRRVAQFHCFPLFFITLIYSVYTNYFSQYLKIKLIIPGWLENIHIRTYFNLLFPYFK